MAEAADATTLKVMAEMRSARHQLECVNKVSVMRSIGRHITGIHSAMDHDKHIDTSDRSSVANRFGAQIRESATLAVPGEKD